MAEVKYTKGEWSFRFYANSDEDVASARKLGIEPVRMLANDGSCTIMSGTGDDRKAVATALCQTPHKRGEGYRTQCAERDANARLIAAAPELLEALQRLDREGLLQVLIDMDAAREDDEPPVAEEAIKAVRAAITKATTPNNDKASAE